MKKLKLVSLIGAITLLAGLIPFTIVKAVETQDNPSMITVHGNQTVDLPDGVSIVLEESNEEGIPEGSQGVEVYSNDDFDESGFVGDVFIPAE